MNSLSLMIAIQRAEASGFMKFAAALRQVLANQLAVEHNLQGGQS
jgi:hypothetical protein